MFGRKIFFLAAGYIAGNIVNSLYEGKRKRVIKHQKQEDMRLMVDTFIDTQKNLLSDLEGKYVPKKHKKAFQIKKKEFFDLAKKYAQKGKEIFAEIGEDERISQGKDHIEKGLLKAKIHGKNAVKKGKELSEKLTDTTPKS